MSVLPPNAFTPTGVSNGVTPAKRQVASIAITLDGNPTVIDLRQYVHTKNLGQVQGLWLDCTNALGLTNIFVADTFQTIQSQAGNTLLLPLYLSQSYTLIINGSANSKLILILLNFEPDPIQFPSTYSDGFVLLHGDNDSITRARAGDAFHAALPGIGGANPRQILVASDTSKLAYINQFRISTRGFFATTPGWLYCEILNEGSIVMFSDYLFVGTTAAPATYATEFSVSDLQMTRTNLLTPPWIGLRFTAGGGLAGPFTGTWDYTFVGGQSSVNTPF